MRYKILDKRKFKKNTLVSLPLPIEPLRIGDKVNNGAAEVVSVALTGTGNLSDITLVLDGKIEGNEIYY